MMTDADTITDNVVVNVGDVGYIFRKEFNDGWFIGKVVKIRPGAKGGKDRRVLYNDGDCEDLTLRELQSLVLLDQQVTKKKATTTSSSDCNDSDGAWPSQSHMSELKELISPKDFSELTKELDNIAVGDEKTGVHVDSAKLRKIGKALINGDDDDDFEFGDEVVVREYIDGGEELLLNIIAAHPASWIVMILIRVSPDTYIPVRVYQNGYLSQYQGLAIVHRIWQHKFQKESVQLLLFPEVIAALGISGYEFGSSLKYERMIKWIKTIKSKMPEKHVGVFSIDANRFHRSAVDMMKIKKELEKLGASVFTLRQFEFPPGKKLDQYIQEWAAAQAKEDTQGATTVDAAKRLRKKFTQHEGLRLEIDAKKLVIEAELQDKESNIHKRVVAGVINGGKKQLMYNSTIEDSDNVAKCIVKYLQKLVIKDVGEDVTDDVSDAVAEQCANDCLEEIKTINQSSGVINEFTNVIWCRMSAKGYSGEKPTGKSKVLKIDEVEDCDGLSLYQLAYCYAYLDLEEKDLEERVQPTDVIMYSRDERSKLKRNGFIWICKMAALGKAKRILASNSVRFSSHKSYIVFLDQLCKHNGIELIGANHAKIAVLLVAEEERSRKKKDARSFRGSTITFDEDMKKIANTPYMKE